MMKQIVFGLSLALASGVALAQEEWNFEDMDADTSGTIDETEFHEGFDEAGLFGEWDEDEDTALSEEEFETGFFESWDQDDDGAISEDEWGEVEEAGFWDW